MDGAFVNRLILPGKGRKYSGTRSRGLVWLRNSFGSFFPNHYIRKNNSKTVVLYSHGNGGTLGDFKHIVSFYAEWFATSVFAIEYPGYGPAEGEASEETVNDNLFTAFKFLTDVLAYPPGNIILIGYSIGTGPTIHLAADLCDKGTPPGAVITLAAFMSVCDIVRDWRGAVFVNLLADVVANRWNSMSRVPKVTCPIFFIHGVLDEMIPAEHSQRLLTACAAQEKRLRLCPQADHTHFDEPGDTIEPIGLFLQEVLRPNVKVVIRAVPNEYYICPQSVKDREAEARSKEVSSRDDASLTEIGDTACNMDCVGTGFTSAFSWIGDIFAPSSGKARGGGGGGAAAGRGGAGAGGGGAGLGGPVGGGGDIGISGGGGAVLVAGSSVSMSSGAEAAAGKMDGTPRRGVQLPGGGLSNGVGGGGGGQRLMPHTPDTPSSESGASRTPKTPDKDEALSVLRNYFAYLCEHNVDRVCKCLDENVLVRYPEEGKGWSSVNTARLKYGRMLERAPGFTASFVVLEISSERAVTTIKAACHFECSTSGLNVTRDILYVIAQDKNNIILIDHKQKERRREKFEKRRRRY